jgi:hypothetical protein
MTRAVCTRCEKRPAFTEESLSRWRTRALESEGPPPPPIPPGICLRCAKDDPDLREPLSEWMKQLVGWAERKQGELIGQVRELVVRPLEAIDRFIDGLR